MNKQLTNLTVAILVSACLAGCGQGDSVEDYIGEAKTQLNENNVNASIIALKNAVKTAPKNAEARYLLGKIYLSQGNSLQAEKELEKALSLNGEPELVIPLLARAHHLNDDIEGIHDLAEKAVKLSDKAKAQYLVFQAIAYLKQDELNKSKRTLAKINSLNDNKVSALTTKAYIHFAERDFVAANANAQEALLNSPKNPDVLMLLANIAGAQKQYKIAAEYFDKHLQLQPQIHSTKILLANALLLSEEYESAEKHADNILAMAPNQPFANYIKAMVRMQEKDYALANKHADLAIQNKFNQPNIKLVAGASAFYLNNFEQANYYLEPLAKHLPKEHFSHRMVLVSQLELGLIEDVTNSLTVPEITSENDQEFYSALSYKLLKQGATEQAKQLIQANSAVDTDNATQLAQDGLLKMMVNDPAAMNQLEKAVKLSPDMTNAEVAIAYLALKQGDINKTKGIAQKWLKEQPEKAQGYNLEAMIALYRNDIVLAKKMLDQAIEKEPSGSFAYIQHTRIAISENEKEKAKSYIDKAVNIAPDSIKVLRLYFRIYQSLGQGEQALAQLKQVMESNEGKPNYQLVYAEALAFNKQHKQSLQILNEIKPTNEISKLYWQLKVLAYNQLNNITMLDETLKEWRKLHPFHIEWVYYLTDLYGKQGEWNNALKTAEKALQMHKENVQLKAVKVQLLLKNNKVKQARNYYESFKSELGNQNSQHYLEGRLLLAERKVEQAIPHLEAVYKANQSSANVLYLFAALDRVKAYERAIELAEHYLKHTGYSVPLASSLANTFLMQGRNKKALAVYKTIINKQPKNILALNNAAWLSMDNGDLTYAEGLVKQALEVMPEEPNVLDTYAQILLKSGKGRQALNTVEKAYLASNKKNNSIALNYAEILIENRRLNQARNLMNDFENLSPQQEMKKIALEKKFNNKDVDYE